MAIQVKNNNASIIDAAANLLAMVNIDLKGLLAKAQQSQSMKQQKQQQYLSVKQVQQKFAIKRHTLWRLLKSGEIDSIKLNLARSGKVLISKASLEAFLDQKRKSRNYTSVQNHS